MRQHHRAWIVGGSLAAGALWLALRGFETAAVGLATAALAVGLLTTTRTIPPDLADAGATGAGDACAGLSAALKLGGRGVVVPGATEEEPSMLFVPARDIQDRALPPLHPDVVIYRDPSGPMGIHIVPPGGGIEAAWRKLHGLPKGAGLEEATSHLRRALPQLGLGRDVLVAHLGGAIRVSYEPDAFRETCERLRSERAPWHVQGACPACSFVAILVARGLRSPVRLSASGTDGKRVHLDMEVHA